METERKRVPKEDLNSKMFLKLIELLKEYVYFKDPVCYILCLIYAIVTYLLDVWDEVPYLKIFGLPGRGKSRLGELFALLSFNSLKSEDISDAFLYRKIAEGEMRGGVTLIIDEKDRLSSKHQGLLLSVLRGGYRRGGKVSRCGPGGRLEEFSTFSPKIIVNIKGILDPALESRTIPIQMFRREGQLVRFRFRRAQKEFDEAKILISWFVEHHRDLISGSYDNFESVEGLLDRDEEVWAPIIVVARLLSNVLEEPSIEQDITALAKRTVGERRRGQLIDNRDLQILVSTRAFVKNGNQVGNGFYVMEEIRDSIIEQWGLNNLSTQAVTRVLNQHGVIEGFFQPHYRPRISSKVQRTCYRLNKERLSEVTKEFVVEDGL